jgi:hypothetical protein
MDELDLYNGKVRTTKTDERQFCWSPTVSPPEIRDLFQNPVKINQLQRGFNNRRAPVPS